MKKHFPVSLATLGALSLLPASVFAHTGMGATMGFVSGFSHPLGGADHLLVMVAVGLWAAQRRGTAVWALPGAFVAAMIVGSVLALSAVHVPYVQAGILVSVLLLGVLIAAAFKLSLAASVIMVAIFAVFHGHAHGAEMPLAMSAVSYTAGFALGTALLHAAGIASAMLLQRLHVETAVRLAGSAIGLGGVYLVLA